MNQQALLDIYGIGNAIVDNEASLDDSFLRQFSLPKGQMTLVDDHQMGEFSHALQGVELRRFGGGSAANTVYAGEAFGLRAGYACRLADDENGRFFRQEMQAANIGLTQLAAKNDTGGQSGQCLVIVSQDAQRTLCTNLGVSSQLDGKKVDGELIGQSRLLYIEGYLSSSSENVGAAMNAHHHARANGLSVALTLSDVSMISFFREALESIMGNGLDILFCNLEEALTWAKTDRLDIAARELLDIAPELYITLGAKGSTVYGPRGHQTLPGIRAVAKDSNGAGDIYAGACLAARLKGAEPPQAAAFGNFAAARIVAQYGARLESREAYQRLFAEFF